MTAIANLLANIEFLALELPVLQIQPLIHGKIQLL